MNARQPCLVGIVLLVFMSGSASAALVSRASGQAYYDTVLNITWVADANLAQTSGYDADGYMTWSEAQAWIASLNAAVYLGKSDWRLPFVVDSGAPGCDLAWGGTDCGYNAQTVIGATVYSEMAHLYYITLGNLGYYDTGGSPTGCDDVAPYCLTNSGPFSNIQTEDAAYWSGTEYALTSNEAWYFLFNTGLQRSFPKGDVSFHAWAVRSGDIVAAPLPGAVWLFGGALGALGWLRRRARLV